MKYDMILKELL